MEQELLKLILVEIREMKESVSEVKTDMTKVKSDMEEVKSDMEEVKTDMTEVKSDMKEVKTRLTNVERNVAENTKDIKSLKELAEFHTESINAIKNVVTNHYMEFKKFVKTNNIQHNLYDAKLLQFNKDK